MNIYVIRIEYDLIKLVHKHSVKKAIGAITDELLNGGALELRTGIARI